jgi:hypothetical protein
MCAKFTAPYNKPIYDLSCVKKINSLQSDVHIDQTVLTGWWSICILLWEKIAPLSAKKSDVLIMIFVVFPGSPN